MNTRSSRLLVAAGIGALTLASLWPVFHAGLWVSDEELHWPRRLSEFAFAIGEGQWWPRWFPNLEWGHGYPYPNFYAPAALWLGWLGFLATHSYLWGIKLAFLVAGVLAPWGMYRFLRPGISRPAALIGAMLYHLAPYHTLNVLVRGNLAEYLAMGLFPWVLWGLSRLGRRHRAKDIILAASLLAAYQLSHNLSALFGTATLVGWIFLSHLWGGLRWKVTAWRIGAIVAACALGTIYWLPALWDIQFVRVGQVMEQIVAADHVIYPLQLLDPRWGWGYSVPGHGDEISLQMGLPQAVALLLGLCVFIRSREHRKALAPWLILCLVLLLVVLPWSAPLWKLPVLRLIQFPWRLLAWIAVATAIVGAQSFDSLPAGRSKAVGFFVMLFILTQLIYSRAEFFRPYQPEHFEPGFTRQYLRSNTTAGEYLPRWIVEPPQVPSRWELGLSGPGSVAAVPGSSDFFDQRWEVELAEPQLVRWDVYRFPNWQVEIDGLPAQVISAPEGVVVFQASAGRHEVRIQWVATPIHVTAQLVSLATLFGLAGWALIEIRRRAGSRPKRRP